MRLAIVLVAQILLSSCWFRHARAPLPRPIPPPLVLPPPDTAKRPPPAPLPPPPALQGPEEAAAIQELPEELAPEINVPAPPVPRRRTPVARSQQEPGPQPPDPAPEPVFELGQVLDPKQRHEFEQQLDRFLAGAEGVVGQCKDVRLTAEQSQLLERIHVFIQQAKSARPKDIQEARNVAERADLLAQELQKTLRR